MRFASLVLDRVTIAEFERRARARAIEDGVIDEALDRLLSACSEYLLCTGPVVVDGDAIFATEWRDAAILFEGGLDVRGGVDDMAAGLVVIGGDLRASTLTITTDWLVTGSMRLDGGLAGMASGPRRVVCEGTLDAPAIVLDGYSLEIGSANAGRYNGLLESQDRKFLERDPPATLNQYARAIEDHRAALDRSRAFFAADQDAFEAAWEACRNPADLIRVFARHADIVFAPSDTTPRGAALLRAAYEALGRLVPVADTELLPAEPLIETWLTRGWNDDDAREASAADGVASTDRSARGVRAYAARRLLEACSCFDRAVKTWHRDEAAEDARVGVLCIVDAISNVVIDDSHRRRCEEVLRERLVCPMLVESMPTDRSALSR